MRKIFLLLYLIIVCCGWYSYDNFNSLNDGDAASTSSILSFSRGMEVDNAQAYGGSGNSIKCSFNTGSENCVEGTLEFADFSVTGGEELWMYMKIRTDAGFSWSQTIKSNQDNVIKGLRWRKYQNETHNGYDSLFFAGSDNHTNGRIFADMEYVPSGYGTIGKIDSPQAPYITTETWHEVEIYFKMNTSGSANGACSFWYDGNLIRSETNWYTFDDVYSNGNISYIKVFSYWNGLPPQEQVCWIDDLFASDEGSFDDVIGGGGGSDTTAPQIANFSPVQDATGVPLTTDIYFELYDAGDGVVDGLTNLTVEGILETGDISFGGTSANRTITLANADISSSLTYNQVINVDWSTSDGTNASSGSYSFTLESEPAVTTPVFATGDMGNADNYTPLNASRWSVVDEGANAVYKINTTEYSSNGNYPGEYALYKDAVDQFHLTIKMRSDENLVSNPYADYCFIINHVSADDFIMIMFNQDSSSCGVWHCYNGEQILLDSREVSLVNDNDFHDVVFDLKNQVLNVYHDEYDGGISPVFTVSNFTFGNFRLGPSSFNDGVSIDNPELTLYPPEAPPAQKEQVIKISGDQTVTITGATEVIIS